MVNSGNPVQVRNPPGDTDTFIVRGEFRQQPSVVRDPGSRVVSVPHYRAHGDPAFTAAAGPPPLSDREMS